MKIEDVYDDIKNLVGDDITKILIQSENFQLPFKTSAALTHYLNNPKEKCDVLMNKINAIKRVELNNYDYHFKSSSDDYYLGP